MPVKKDENGQRSVEAEVEVPGTPEQVWKAIATGEGISSWFVPSEVEEKEGGAAVSHFGPGNTMDAVGTVKVWQPPHQFVVETTEGPGAVASEWTVQAKSGSTCVVRVVHRWFASTDEWDNQFEGHTYGWQSFFRILRLHLEHFAGQSCASFQVMGTAPEPKGEAWMKFLNLLGIREVTLGQGIFTVAGAPPLNGIVRWAGQEMWPEDLLVTLDRPAPGIAHVTAHPMAGQVFLCVRMYLSGPGAKAVVQEAETTWQQWMSAHFGTVPETNIMDCS
ncbi:uncharacterized protein YndB with AHSA1/START domain [Roseimicrobium gellanilyticum]|uniref:Uncharacterized protein YndB with AHSA1/START domain n=1 Tax=Roseimicrobium gellanilyticum TaxID=748857 RepID=A0A366HIR9_9BACT|nr:SRPBCC domain-containing protein [Roseimicrobium gellanilyticum]RBP41499.1 uncharacterized protein YndB with AHSA1/START domain [Roseimicrobium gellanilyticum]